MTRKAIFHPLHYLILWVLFYLRFSLSILFFHVNEVFINWHFQLIRSWSRRNVFMAQRTFVLFTGKNCFTNVKNVISNQIWVEHITENNVWPITCKVPSKTISDTSPSNNPGIFTSWSFRVLFSDVFSSFVNQLSQFIPSSCWSGILFNKGLFIKVVKSIMDIQNIIRFLAIYIVLVVIIILTGKQKFINFWFWKGNSIVSGITTPHSLYSIIPFIFTLLGLSDNLYLHTSIPDLSSLLAQNITNSIHVFSLSFYKEQRLVFGRIANWMI